MEVHRVAVAPPSELQPDGHWDGTGAGADVPDQVGVIAATTRRAGEIVADALDGQ